MKVKSRHLIKAFSLQLFVCSECDLQWVYLFHFLLTARQCSEQLIQRNIGKQNLANNLGYNQSTSAVAFLLLRNVFKSCIFNKSVHKNKSLGRYSDFFYKEM